MTSTTLHESDLQRAILARLNALSGVLAYRVNAIVARASDRFVRSVRKGHADIIACANGRFIAIEVKSRTGRQSPAQAEFQRSVESAGGWYLLARDVESVIYGVQKIRDL